MRTLIFSNILIFCLLGHAEKLPQVLVIGDQNYHSFRGHISAALKNKAKVQFTKCGSFNSSQALENFDQLLEGKKWDLIHFNYGLYDLMHVDPKTKDVRALHKDVGGVIAVSEEQYEKNLRELVKRFRAAGAKVVWGSTTPIVGSDGILMEGDEVRYNKIADKVMKDLKVPVTDMYGKGKKIHASIGDRFAKTFSYKKDVSLGDPIIESIRKELNLKK